MGERGRWVWHPDRPQQGLFRGCSRGFRVVTTPDSHQIRETSGEVKAVVRIK
jgi:hypothetical protein